MQTFNLQTGFLVPASVGKVVTAILADYKVSVL